MRYFKFIEGIKKHKSVLQISQTSASSPRPTLAALKEICENPKYIEKSLTTHYIDHF